MTTGQLDPEIVEPPARGGGWRAQVGVVAGLAVLVGAVLGWGPSLLRGLPPGGIDPVARFLLAVSVIVLVSHLLGAALGRLRQPPVVGEIIGGLLLGPSVLGLVWPAGWAWLFPAEVRDSLEMAAQLGLVTFMFLLGCELRVDRVRADRKAVGLVVVGSLGVPFLGGLAVAVLSESALAGASVPSTAYVLFFGLAMSITALPVLARLLVDLRLDGSRLGTLALSCAAIGDAVAWVVLTVILATTGMPGSGSVVTTAGLAVALVLVTVLCVRPLLAVVVRRLEGRRGGDQLLLAVLVAGAMGFAALTQLIGLHPVIGAFLFGVATPRRSAATERIGRQLQGFAVTILLPLFFAGVGLSTVVGLLGAAPAHWLLFAAVLGTASLTKFVGAGGGARLAGIPAREALRVGTLMNCRGVTELVVATIGLQYKVINTLGFTILVLVALITTAATGPLMWALTPRAAPLPADQTAS